jgi:hypothetical protein
MKKQQSNFMGPGVIGPGNAQTQAVQTQTQTQTAPQKPKRNVLGEIFKTAACATLLTAFGYLYDTIDKATHTPDKVDTKSDVVDFTHGGQEYGVRARFWNVSGTCNLGENDIRRVMEFCSKAAEPGMIKPEAFQTEKKFLDSVVAVLRDEYAKIPLTSSFRSKKGEVVAVRFKDGTRFFMDLEQGVPINGQEVDDVILVHRKEVNGLGYTVGKLPTNVQGPASSYDDGQVDFTRYSTAEGLRKAIDNRAEGLKDERGYKQLAP